MTPPLVLRHVALDREGPTLALTLEPGRSLALVGRAGAGKSRLSRVFAGEERPATGVVEAVPACVAGPAPGKARVRDLAGEDDERAATALTAAGLWDRRGETVASLSPAARAAADLLPALSGREGLVLVDGLLDALDPWTLGGVRAGLAARAAEGAAIVYSTHRPDLAEGADLLLWLEGGRIRFVGPPTELRRRAGPVELTVEHGSRSAVLAIADPFEFTVRDEGDRLVLRAPEGQTLAAKLLLEGYGVVRTVTVREPTLADALGA